MCCINEVFVTRYHGTEFQVKSLCNYGVIMEINFADNNKPIYLNLIISVNFSIKILIANVKSIIVYHNSAALPNDLI